METRNILSKMLIEIITKNPPAEKPRKGCTATTPNDAKTEMPNAVIIPTSHLNDIATITRDMTPVNKHPISLFFIYFYVLKWWKGQGSNLHSFRYILELLYNLLNYFSDALLVSKWNNQFFQA